MTHFFNLWNASPTGRTCLAGLLNLAYRVVSLAGKFLYFLAIEAVT